MADDWKLLFGSAKGTSHERTGEPCQDFALCRHFRVGTTPILVATCADGAGSAIRAQIGARLACTTFLNLAVTAIADGLPIVDIDSQHVRHWLGLARARLSLEACLSNLDLRDFACTLLTAISSPEGSVFSQIGDGAIVIRKDQGYEVVFWPQSGEFANTTNFLTGADFEDHLEFRFLNDAIDDLAVITDGLQSLALNYASRKVHTPFFVPMFESLRKENYSDELEGPLLAFLNSAAVNERTDDDKTLILATRRCSSNGCP